MFNNMKITLAAAAVATLSGCGGPNAIVEANGGIPPMSDVQRVAKQSYQDARRKDPSGMQILEVKYAPVFFDQLELIVCLSTQETRGGDWFDNDGNIVSRAGDPYVAKHIMLMRKYPNGWGSGIFRRVGSGKIGSANITDICPV